jgi:hypothetical protein
MSDEFAERLKKLSSSHEAPKNVNNMIAEPSVSYVIFFLLTFFSHRVFTCIICFTIEKERIQMQIWKQEEGGFLDIVIFYFCKIDD